MSANNRVNVIEFDDEDFRPIYPVSPIANGRIRVVTPERPRMVSSERQANLIPNYPDSPIATRGIRVVTPERRRPQFVPVYSEDLYDGSHFVHIIGVFDTQIAACHATIKWLIENEKGIDPESNAWETDYSPEEAIEYLCGLVTQWRELKQIAYRYSDKYENDIQGWFIKLQRFN